MASANPAPAPVRAGAGEPQHYPDGRYLTFLLAGETFALDILRIKEVIQYAQCTTVPMMPRFVHGVINLRGRVVPIIDLRARFGHGACNIGRRSCIVILEVGDSVNQQDIGVIVDAVQQVLQIAGSQVEPPPTFGARVRADFILGMGKVNERFVILLDTDKVLSIEEMETLVKVAGESGADDASHAAA